MLTNESKGKDWKAATPEEKRDYIEACCQRSTESGVKPISPSMLEDGISEYYRFHEKYDHELDEAHGIILSAIIKFGHYGPMTSKWT